MRIMVGLGNPGDKYKITRHNIGYLALDTLTEKENINWRVEKKFNSAIATLPSLTLVKPLTFMNNSGTAVKKILNYYKLLPKNWNFFISDKTDLNKILIVVHDDIDIELGKYKISKNSGSAGHKGVDSIINNLKTKKFLRLRIGIKTERTQFVPTPSFVLEKFTKQELETIKKILPKALTNIF